MYLDVVRHHCCSLDGLSFNARFVIFEWLVLSIYQKLFDAFGQSKWIGIQSSQCNLKTGRH